MTRPATTVLSAATAEFNRVFGVPTPSAPTADIPAEIVYLRVRLVAEEHQEVAEAITSGDLHEIAKECADYAYVLQGSADAYGITLTPATPAGRHAADDGIDPTRLLDALQLRDLDAIAEEISDLLVALRATATGYGIDLDTAITQVHASNMSKLDDDGAVIRDAGGKILKSSNYRLAHMTPALRSTAA